jgi:hypothetical protein
MFADALVGLAEVGQGLLELDQDHHPRITILYMLSHKNVADIHAKVYLEKTNTSV